MMVEASLIATAELLNLFRKINHTKNDTFSSVLIKQYHLHKSDKSAE